jgi:hypothetical protein
MSWSSVDKVSADGHWWQHLTLNWFDVALVLILAFGVWRGRKHGMSREALPTAMWLLAVIAGGFACVPLGEMLQKTGVLNHVFGVGYNQRTMSRVVCYLLIGLIALTLNASLKKVFKEKVSGSNAFGDGEYYLGMISGMIRYACMVIFCLALLHAPFYSSAEIVANKAWNNRWFGGGEKNFKGDFFPSIADIQQDVFKKSFLGAAINNGLEPLLIESVAPAKKTPAKS